MLNLEELEYLLNDLFGELPRNEKKFPIAATWKTSELDIPVILTGISGKKNGINYYSIHGSKTAIPENEIVYEENN